MFPVQYKRNQSLQRAKNWFSLRFLLLCGRFDDTQITSASHFLLVGAFFSFFSCVSSLLLFSIQSSAHQTGQGPVRQASRRTRQHDAGARLQGEEAELDLWGCKDRDTYEGRYVRQIVKRTSKELHQGFERWPRY